MARRPAPGGEVDSYPPTAQCVLTTPAAEALARVQAALVKEGLSLRVYDCYRPQKAVDEFVAWSQREGLAVTGGAVAAEARHALMKAPAAAPVAAIVRSVLRDRVLGYRLRAHYYSNVPTRGALFERGYIASASGHSRGSTVDLGLERLPGWPADSDRPAATTTSVRRSLRDHSGFWAPGHCALPWYARRIGFADAHAPLRVAGAPGPGLRSSVAGDGHDLDGARVLDMGTSFDCFDVRSHTVTTASSHAHDDRIIDGRRRHFVRAMAREGFVNLPTEWWHFTLSPEPFPDTYFNFDLPSEP